MQLFTTYNTNIHMHFILLYENKGFSWKTQQFISQPLGKIWDFSGSNTFIFNTTNHNSLHLKHCVFWKTYTNFRMAYILSKRYLWSHQFNCWHFFFEITSILREPLSRFGNQLLGMNVLTLITSFERCLCI